jgi:hypothetical protein
MNLSGRDLSTVQRCRKCGCHDAAPCLHNGTQACYWVADDLCSACSELFDDLVYQTMVCSDCEGEGIAQVMPEGVRDVIEIHCVKCRGVGGLSREKLNNDQN